MQKRCVLLVAEFRCEAKLHWQGEDETLLSDLTRALIKGLPRLFIKYQTDANRIANVLLIPPLMTTELYLEMRMMTVSCISDASRLAPHKFPLLVLYPSFSYLLTLQWGGAYL